ncbi:MAG TPA: hypothetical protein VFT04_10685 [Gemmatimonadales bacterium]|nr:hypothetical protein [Gemmatimonadales bacterium]
MTSTWGRIAGCAFALGTLWLAAGPAEAQRARELGLHAVFTAQDDELVAGGLYGAIRTTRRTRLALTAAAGSAGGEFVARGEILGHFLLSPASRGVGVYGGGGIAGIAGAGEEGFLVLLIGLEHAPGGSAGWYLEGGVGGGARISAGYRWRWFAARNAGR